MKTLKNFPNLLNFQKANIDKGIAILRRDNALFDFTQTGLGKTVVTATIAYNLSKNKVLVVCPKAVRNNWVKAFDGCEIKVDVCGMQKITDENGYDFVIIDEAHRMSNKTGLGYKKLFEKIHLMDNPYTMLLTATPYQNRFSELMDMFGLMNFSMDSVGFNILPTLLTEMVKNEKSVKNIENHDTDPDLLAVSYLKLNENNKHVYTASKKNLLANTKLFSSFLGYVSIMATREGLVKNYKNDVVRMGLFPKVEKKDVENYFLYDNGLREVLALIEKMPVSIYNIGAYFRKENEQSFAGIFKTFLLKRMESSIAAFLESVSNIKKTVDSCLETQTVEYNGKKENIHEVKNLYEDLLKDSESLGKMLDIFSKANDDNKHEKLLKTLKEKDGKTIIFTEYNITAKNIEKYLKNNGIKCVLYNSDSKASELEVILADFDPSHEKPTNDIDVLITTDVLSEGVSLHKSDRIIHFDQKYNPSKTIQRFGRINRINNIHETVMEVFFPTPKPIENIILLEGKINFKNENAENMFINYELPFVFNRGVFDPKKNYSDKSAFGKYVRVNLGDCLYQNSDFDALLEKSSGLFRPIYAGKDALLPIEANEKVYYPDFIFSNNGHNVFSAYIRTIFKNFNNVEKEKFVKLLNPLYVNQFYALTIENIKAKDVRGRFDVFLIEKFEEFFANLKPIGFSTEYSATNILNHKNI